MHGRSASQIAGAEALTLIRGSYAMTIMSFSHRQVFVQRIFVSRLGAQVQPALHQLMQGEIECSRPEGSSRCASRMVRAPKMRFSSASGFSL